MSQRKIQKLISKSRIMDLRNGGQHRGLYVFWGLLLGDLRAAASRSTRLTSTPMCSKNHRQFVSSAIFAMRM
jgi:hypothetical protein